MGESYKKLLKYWKELKLKGQGIAFILNVINHNALYFQSIYLYQFEIIKIQLKWVITVPSL